MARKTILLFLMLCGTLLASVSSRLYGQNAFDAFRYSMQYPAGGAASMGMPGSGLVIGQGLGGTIDNPASAALFEYSGTFAAYNFRHVSETGHYLGSPEEASGTQNSFANIGFAYKVPTRQGSLVFGAGYVQTTDYDRALEVSGYNHQSSITFMFNQSSFYGDAAYNAFAIDSIRNRTQSVLRFGGFKGIHQDMQLTQHGQMGEITAFAATEYLKDLFVGISLNIPVGSYRYDRTFIEQDTRNLYQFEGPTYDVGRIVNRDIINADISGFRARVGTIYKPSDHLNIGLNYQFRSTLTVDEEYSTLIETTFDNGDNFKGSFDGTVRYKVETPGRLSGGVALADLHGFTLTATAEWINYGNMSMAWPEDNSTNSTYFIEENEFIERSFESVLNYSGALSYEISPVVRPYAGYAYHPDPYQASSSDRRFFSGGVNLGAEKQLQVKLGFQYALWEDQLTLYEYKTAQNNWISEVAGEDVGRLKVVAGLSYRF